MDNSLSNKPAAVKVRCADCGVEFSNYAWTPGTACPKCHGTRFEPVVMVGTQSDYDDADRSQGFAREDIRFGRLAQWAELVTPKQLQRALFQQSQYAKQGGMIPDLASLMVKEKMLTRRQADAILAARCVEPGNTEDIEFGITAVRMGFTTEERVNRCRGQQREAIESGRDVPPLPILACENRFMREAQVLAILKNTEQRHRGLLHTIKRAAEKPTRRRRGRGGAGSFSDFMAQPIVRFGSIAIGALLLGFVVYSLFIAPESRYATVRCDECHAETGMPVTTPWPGKCPACQKNAIYPLAICRQCGKRFIVKDTMGYGLKCPQCGSGEYLMITNDRNVAEEIRAIEANARSTNSDVGN